MRWKAAARFCIYTGNCLTAQIVTRLMKVFGDRLGVYHSKFSDNERVEVWNGVLSGRFQVVVGVVQLFSCLSTIFR